ncbi:ABC transporter permease [Acidisphaera sp. S103]|uniref:ABC transporter permease n=1 Tax=Acidisphaera sp. S103 TaxID=1747223 RepID=UPI00131DB401|nr:ABC transporter permease [Acidisphaera sp. S103]
MRVAKISARAWLPIPPAIIAPLFPIVLLALWSVSARFGWLPPQILPSPGEVWAALLDMAHSGDLAGNAGISLLRVVEGFAAGSVLGLLLGVAMGLSPKTEDYVKPLFTAFAQVPTLGWIPFLMLLVGIGEPLKVLVIAKAAFVPVTLNTLAGIRAVPPMYREVGALFRFSRWQLLRKVVLPAAVPPIFTGLRYGLTHAWNALVAVELLASAEGLGYLLVWGRQMFWLDTMMAAMLIIGIVGFTLDRIMAAVEARLQRWRLA